MFFGTLVPSFTSPDKVRKTKNQTLYFRRPLTRRFRRFGGKFRGGGIRTHDPLHPMQVR